MPRKVTTQWEFGELFSPAATRRIYSVTEITGRIRRLVEGLGEVWVSGEVSNLRAQASGHLYFTLKDANAQLNCVLFRGTPVADRSMIRDGQRLAVHGTVTVYEPRGQHQLIVREVELQGVGALQAAFEALKRRLQAEGLFDPARKRPIPRFPRRIGLVTSPTGAAIRDVAHVLERRYPALEVVLAGCRVQGQGAAAEIAAAIRALNAWSTAGADRRLDLILVTRGGGSLEDLWAFNEEIVARAIAGSEVPVISAVGHEIDFTIADFAADLRAATPSAAAEIITAGYVEACEWIARQVDRLRRLARNAVAAEAEALASLARRLQRAHPRRRLQERMQRLDEAQAALSARVRDCMRWHRERLNSLATRLARLRPERRLAVERQRVEGLERELGHAFAGALRRKREQLERLGMRLELLSPERVLARGYSITREQGTGRVLRRAEDVAEGVVLQTRLAAGEVTSVVIPAPRVPRGRKRAAGGKE